MFETQEAANGAASKLHTSFSLFLDGLARILDLIPSVLGRAFTRSRGFVGRVLYLVGRIINLRHRIPPVKNVSTFAERAFGLSVFCAVAFDPAKYVLGDASILTLRPQFLIGGGDVLVRAACSNVPASLSNPYQGQDNLSRCRVQTQP